MIYVVPLVAVLCLFMKEILGFWPLSQHSPLSLLSVLWFCVYSRKCLRRVFTKEPMNVIIVPETTLQAFRLFSLVFSAAKSKHPSVTIFYLLFVLFTVGISSFFWKGYGFLIITWGGIV